MIDIARAKAIPGWMSDKELRWLARRAASAKVIIEVGCWQGRSTRVLADHCRGRVFAVDPWDGVYIADNGSVHPIDTNVFDKFAEHLSDHIASGRVVTVRAKSADGLRDLANFNVRPDFIFIDGDHREAVVRDDIAVSRTLLVGGGLLAGHDHKHKDWPAVARVVDELFPQRQLCDSIWSVEV